MIEEIWFEELPVKTIGRTVRCYKKVTSTNDVAWLEVSRGSPEGVVILADEQLKGRGRFGRTWHAPRDTGLWASVVLRPRISIDKAPLIMVIGAIAIVELLREKYSLPAAVRWPNDVLVRDKKLAGIIVETKCLRTNPEAVVLGIGLNVNMQTADIPEELQATTTSVALEFGCYIDPRELSRNFLLYLDKWYQKIIQEDFTAVAAAWWEMSGVMNKTVLVETAGQVLEGIVTALDPCGGITLKLPEGERCFPGEQVTSLRLKK